MLAGHPERELIVRRYLKYQRGLARGALSRLLEEDYILYDELLYLLRNLIDRLASEEAD